MRGGGIVRYAVRGLASHDLHLSYTTRRHNLAETTHMHAKASTAMPDSSTPDATTADVVELQQRLVQCQAAVQALQREQELLAHGIAHDLRAPLRAIESFSGLIAAGGSLDATARSHLTRVRAAASRMGRLIDALLELSRANRAELKLEHVDLGLLVEWAGAELQETHPLRPAQIQVVGDLRVLGDERLLKILVCHLLSNAWQFSGERDSVWMQASGERIDGRVRVSVRDHGSGFDMRYAQKVFEPFQRLVGPEQGGGDGMGLAIAQRIVERHGGCLDCESEPGVGSTFHFDLPATHAPA